MYLTYLTPLQEKAYHAVQAWGSKYGWFRGVCMDDFPTDKELQEDFDGCVSGICFATAMWDDPDFYDGLGISG